MKVTLTSQEWELLILRTLQESVVIPDTADSALPAAERVGWEMEDASKFRHAYYRWYKKSGQKLRMPMVKIQPLPTRAGEYFIEIRPQHKIPTGLSLASILSPTDITAALAKEVQELEKNVEERRQQLLSLRLANEQFLARKQALEEELARLNQQHEDTLVAPKQGEAMPAHKLPSLDETIDFDTL